MNNSAVHFKLMELANCFKFTLDNSHVAAKHFFKQMFFFHSWIIRAAADEQISSMDS